MSVADNDGATGVTAALILARDLGFLGPGPIERHLLHAQGFVDLAKSQPRTSDEAHVLDLGSGGGLPGLVLAEQWDEANLVLLDANQRRTDFLRGAVVSCGFEERVRVVLQRAELAGRDPRLRGEFDGVVVRSFGSPAVVAECAAPFLRVGGWLIVSEPPVASTVDGTHGARPAGSEELEAELDPSPDQSGRWPAESLTQLGLTPIAFERTAFSYQVLRQTELCSERFPRRDGVPSRKPLF